MQKNEFFTINKKPYQKINKSNIKTEMNLFILPYCRKNISLIHF